MFDWFTDSFLFLESLQGHRVLFIYLFVYCIPFYLPCLHVVALVVAQADSASAVENQTVEDPQTSRFTWTIENFSRLNTKKHYSEIFVVGGFKW